MAKSEFTPRMKQILLALLKEDQPVPAKYLAEQIGTSKRTVQRELEFIPKAVKKYGITFCSKTGTGIWLEGTPEEKALLKSSLDQEDAFDISDRTERQKRLTLEILKDKTLKKLYYYSTLFGVSEATISSDLEAIGGWFHDNNLEIMRKPGFGVFIEGSERDFRRALRTFIDENINTGMIQELYENKTQSVLDVIQDQNERNIYRLLDDTIVKQVTSCILRSRDKRIMNLTQDSYLGLVIHVTIAVNRILKEEIIEDNPVLIQSLKNDSEYRLAESISHSLEQQFSITIPEIERAYICLHIKGSKIQQMTMDESSQADINATSELWEVVDEMIDCYDSELAYLLKQDEEFVVQGLLAHIKPTLVRLANGMNIQNPLLEQIKSDYADIFNRCIEVAKVITRHYGYQVPEPEIGFLAIHFGAANMRLEGRKASQNRRKVDIGVVCASGIGISRLMLSKIQRTFAERVALSAYGAADLSPFVLNKNDFLVSTLPLKEDADILYVSPLLANEDMERMGRKVQQYEYLPKKDGNQEFTRQLDQVNRIAVQIKHIIDHMEYLKVDNSIGMEELLIAISEKLTPYADRQRMIQEDILKRERLGSQIFPSIKIALFHSRTTGVSRPVIAVCQTKDQKPFKAPVFQSIEGVLVMLVPLDDFAAENGEILGVLSERLIEEESFLAAVCHGEKEEIRAMVSNYLKQYFKRYLDKM